ncbi:MAG: hypothetical protein IJ774_00530 [Selenomonadaceae bacterium]|nr:hypothetical protein [Selenomonadaceae bacterium]
MAKYLDQNGSRRLVDNVKTSHSALNTKINSEMVARQNFAANVTDSISALDGKIDAAAADLVQTIAVDGSTLSITSGAGTTDTYLIQDTTYDLATTTNAGLMSASEKSKLDGLSAFELPTASTSTKGGVKIGNGLAMNGDTLNVTLSVGGTNSNNFTEQVTLSGGFVSKSVASDLSYSSITAGNASINVAGASLSGNPTFTGKPTLSGGFVAKSIEGYLNHSSIDAWYASIDLDSSSIYATDVLIDASGTISGSPIFTGKPEFNGGFFASSVRSDLSNATIKATSASINARNASINACGASIDAGVSNNFVSNPNATILGNPEFSGNPNFSGNPTFTGYVTFTEPIYIDNTGSTVKGALCFDVANNLPRLKVRMNGVDYIFNCDTSVTSGSG